MKSYRHLAIVGALAAAYIANEIGAQTTAPARATKLPPPPPEFDPPALLVPPALLAVADDLEVTVWAKAPLVRNPTNIDVDFKGRVWVTEGVNYRRHFGRDPAGDRVTVIEDTDGNGIADRATPFVQEPGLVAPLGMAVIDNQIVVSNAPDLIVYTDVDRNGVFDPRVDRRDVLLTGFLGHNHDHSLHSVTFGPDGKWYFSHGNCGALVTDRSGRTFRIGSVYGGAENTYGWKAMDIAGAQSDDGHVYVGGVAFRMNPDGTRLEVIGQNFRNSYEQSVTSFGDVFQSDNDDPPGCRTTFLMEHGNLGYFSADGTRNWKADQRPGQVTAIAEWRQQDPGTIPAGDVYGNGSPTGMVTYEGDAFGEKGRGLLLSCEPGRNTVFGYRPKPQGAGYELERFDFLTSNRERDFVGIDSRKESAAGELKTWFRPSDVAVGPDGAIYVADWFDPRVGGHQDLDRSSTGTIYRITPKGARLTTPKLDLATVDGQIAALCSPAINVRASGFLRLRANGAASTAAVSALLTNPNPFIRARAVFLLAQLGAEGESKVIAALSHPDANTRIAAYRALRRADKPFLNYARKLADDLAPAVRREVALSLRDVPATDAVGILAKLAESYDGKDRAYLEAWGIGTAGKESDVYSELSRRAPKTDPTQWPSPYVDLIWRLTPAGAEPVFLARATAAGLAEADRLSAVTALGFIRTQAAGNAMLDIAQRGRGRVRDHAVWWLLNRKQGQWPQVAIDKELKSRGIYDPTTITVSPSVVPEPPPTSSPPSVSEILALIPNPKHGEQVASACMLCHRIGNGGVEYGPGLAGFAKSQPAAVVINSILNPSADIAHGYDGVEVALKNGAVVHGLLLRAGDPTVIQSMGGVTQMIPANLIRQRVPLGRSLMLSAAQLGLSAQDVADVASFLRTQ